MTNPFGVVGRSAAGLVTQAILNTCYPNLAIADADESGNLIAIEVLEPAPGPQCSARYLIRLEPFEADYVGADLSLRGPGTAYYADHCWWFEPTRPGAVEASMVDLGDLRFALPLREVA